MKRHPRAAAVRRHPHCQARPDQRGVAAGDSHEVAVAAVMMDADAAVRETEVVVAAAAETHSGRSPDETAR